MTRHLLLILGVVGCPAPSDSDPSTDLTDGTDQTDGTDPPPSPDLPIITDAPDLDPDPDHLQVRLVAAPYEFEVNGEMVMGYAYNGQVPGPTLRAKRGDRITAEIVNTLDVPTTVHWHGVHVPYAMDGVTWTEQPIAPGATFTASFVVDQAGTFWYHPHFDTARQVDLGLYGALIIADPTDPEPDLDVVIIGDSWGETDSHHALEGSELTWTLNGEVNPTFRPPSGQTARLRFINASNAGYLHLDPPDSPSWIAGDQGLRGRATTGDEVLGPGDRADLSWPIGTEAATATLLPYSVHGGATSGLDPVGRLNLEPTGTQAAPAPLAWPHDPQPPPLDPGHTDIRLVFQGDSNGNTWTINGETFPDVTVSELRLGDAAIIEIRNISPAEHPFHLHGYEFDILSLDGVAPQVRTIEDTFNVPIRSTLRVRIVADNPGSWMAHCHILPHAKDGMMTVIDVVP